MWPGRGKELRDPGPRAQGPGPRAPGAGREGGDPKWIAAAAARRTLLTQETQPEDYGTKLRRCKRAEWEPSVGRLLVVAFHSGTVIGQVGRPRTAMSPPTYRMTLMIYISHADVGADVGADADADAHWSCWHISNHKVRSGLIYTTG